jgi:adenylate kinase family enzyme
MPPTSTDDQEMATIAEPTEPIQPSDPRGPAAAPQGPTMRQVAIVGSGGSGKSTLAATLGQRLDLPVIHLDLLFWKPGWVERPQEEWRAMQRELVRQPAWIIDGNHAKTLDVRLSVADTVIFLDFGRVACMWGIVGRRLRYRNKPRFDRAEGCGERLDLPFMRWVWTFPHQGRPEVLAAIEGWAGNANVVRLRSRRDVRRFLDGLPQRTP